MFGFMIPHDYRSHYVKHHSYFRDLVNSSSGTGVMCYDQQCQEGEECCHTMDFGMAYCCPQLSGLVYLGVMVGGGFIIALLVICCYVFMRGKEKQLEAAAQLEAAKAVSTAMSSAHEAIQLAGEVGSHSSSTDDINAPPPSYGDVVRTLQRCHSYDVSVMSSPRDDSDVSTSIGRQLSEGCRHPNDAEVSALPPLPPCNTLESKLPTYEQCTASANQFITENSVTSVYTVNCNSVQPSDEGSGVNDNTSSRSLHPGNPNTCDGAKANAPGSVVREEQLTTPTQVDDDTGIVQPRAQHEEAAAASSASVEPEDTTSGSGIGANSVRCRLEFRWGAYDHSEIAIGYKNKGDNATHDAPLSDSSTTEDDEDEGDSGAGPDKISQATENVSRESVGVEPLPPSSSDSDIDVRTTKSNHRRDDDPGDVVLHQTVVSEGRESGTMVDDVCSYPVDEETNPCPNPNPNPNSNPNPTGKIATIITEKE